MNTQIVYLDCEDDKKQWTSYLPESPRLVRIGSATLTGQGTSSLPTNFQRNLPDESQNLLLAYIHFSETGSGNESERLKRIGLWVKSFNANTKAFAILVADGGLLRLRRDFEDFFLQNRTVMASGINFATGKASDCAAAHKKALTALIAQIPQRWKASPESFENWLKTELLKLDEKIAPSPLPMAIATHLPDTSFAPGLNDTQILRMIYTLSVLLDSLQLSGDLSHEGCLRNMLDEQCSRLSEKKRNEFNGIMSESTNNDNVEWLKLADSLAASILIK